VFGVDLHERSDEINAEQGDVSLNHQGRGYGRSAMMALINL